MVLLTCLNKKQAYDRSKGKKNKGEAAKANYSLLMSILLKNPDLCEGGSISLNPDIYEKTNYNPIKAPEL